MNSPKLTRKIIDNNRVYHDHSTGEKAYSTTTIISKLLKNKKTTKGKTGLDYWKENNNGKGHNADWNHILEYKKHRGTLAHYHAMHRFDHKFDEAPSMWTEDEKQSREKLEELGENKDFCYSVFKDRNLVNTKEGDAETSLIQLLEKDTDWIAKKFDEVCREQRIKASTVTHTEKLFLNTVRSNFGGQIDLIYRKPGSDGSIIADIKTSSSVYPKHKYQAAAYAFAAEATDYVDVDFVEKAQILRFNPGYEQVEVFELSRDDLKEYRESFLKYAAKTQP